MLGWRILFDILYYGTINCTGNLVGPSFYGAVLVSHAELANESSSMAFPAMCQPNASAILYASSAPTTIGLFDSLLSYHTNLNGASELVYNECYSNPTLWGPFHMDAPFSMRLVPRGTTYLCDDAVNVETLLELSSSTAASSGPASSTALEPVSTTTVPVSTTTVPVSATQQSSVTPITTTRPQNAQPNHDNYDDHHSTDNGDDTIGWLIGGITLLIIITVAIWAMYTSTCWNTNRYYNQQTYSRVF